MSLNHLHAAFESLDSTPFTWVGQFEIVKNQLQRYKIRDYRFKQMGRNKERSYTVPRDVWVVVPPGRINHLGDESMSRTKKNALAISDTKMVDFGKALLEQSQTLDREDMMKNTVEEVIFADDVKTTTASKALATHTQIKGCHRTVLGHRC